MSPEVKHKLTRPQAALLAKIRAREQGVTAHHVAVAQRLADLGHITCVVTRDMTGTSAWCRAIEKKEEES